MHVSVESLKPIHGDQAVKVYNEIAKLVGGDPVSGDKNPHEGGIALSGALDPANRAFTDAERAWLKSVITEKSEPKKGDKN